MKYVPEQQIAIKRNIPIKSIGNGNPDSIISANKYLRTGYVCL